MNIVIFDGEVFHYTSALYPPCALGGTSANKCKQMHCIPYIPSLPSHTEPRHTTDILHCPFPYTIYDNNRDAPDVPDGTAIQTDSI